MKKQNYEVEILINGSSIKEYFHDSKIYVEGRDSANFSIRIKNNGYKKIVAIPSVDGLSVIDGKNAGFDSSGYILSGYDSIVIDGWRISDEEVKKFFFTNPSNSYAEKKNNGGNLGVIGVAIFREKEMPKFNHDFFSYTTTASEFNPSCIDTTPKVTCLNKNLSTSASSEQVMASNSQELGTGWGESKQSAVTTVSFERESYTDAQFEIFYNTRTQLERLGVDFQRRPQHVSPSSFPGEYCKPPQN